MTTEDTKDSAPDPQSGARSRTQDRILAVAILAAAGGFWYDSANIAAAEAKMFPRLILGVMGLLAVLLFARSFRLPEFQRAEPIIADRKRFALFVGAMCIYAVAVPEIGFFTASVIYVPIAAYLTGLRRVWVNIVVTAVFLVATYLIFVTLFSRPLPAEIWEYLL